MRNAAMWSFVLVVVAALGCGGEGYETRKAPPGEAPADAAAVGNDMNKMSGGTQKP
jgi:hypothetical protein